MVHWPSKLYYNWPQLTVQLMVNDVWRFTFCHLTHGCDVNGRELHLNRVFPKIDDSGNVGNKGIKSKKSKINSTKKLPTVWGLNPGP